jgi:purine-binding chemotaxis protein CheW
VVPVVDLRIKFSMSEAEYNQFTVVIVVTVGTRVFGLVVDAVSDVMNIPRESIEATPSLGRDVDTSFMTGMAKSNDKLIALLDIDKLICEDVLGSMETAN